MIRYRVPATSANLGVGFDCMGLAFNIYNTYSVEKSGKFIFEGFADGVLEDNLFYKAYLRSCEILNLDNVCIHVLAQCDIPISRGLGSSSALIVGGICAAYLIHDITPDRKRICEIATSIEGHPDNVTPCIMGGLCVCHNGLVSRFEVSDLWHFYLLIPNYEVQTAQARKVLPKTIFVKDAVNNIASALIGVSALCHFETEKIAVLNNDAIHEPYRRSLIADYEKCKAEALKQGAKAFLISGSGSTMLMIADRQIQMEMKDIRFVEVKVEKEGTQCLKNY